MLGVWVVLGDNWLERARPGMRLEAQLSSGGGEGAKR